MDRVTELSEAPSNQGSWLAPSELARRQAAFGRWQVYAGVRMVDEPCNEARTLYSQLCEFTPPQWLSDLSQEELLEGQGDFFRSLKAWARSTELSPDDKDAYNVHLKSLLPLLSVSFLRIKNSLESNEFTQRRGIDDIIELAFGLKKKHEFVVLFEQSLRLRASPSVRVKPNAVADTFVTLPAGHLNATLITDFVKLVPPRGAAVVSDASWASNVWQRNSVIVLPGEYKKTDMVTNSNQLAMDFGTAQSQRRALGLADDVMFGLAGARGIITVYSSWWEKDKISYAKNGVWTLTDPAQFVCFYVFLCKLADHLHTLQVALHARTPKDSAATVQGHPWRAPDPPPSTLGSKRSRYSDHDEGGGETSGSADVAHDDLEPMEVNDWKHSMDAWRAERKRAWDEVTDSGVSSLSRDRVEKHAKSLRRPSDWGKALTDSVETWRSNVAA